ncbi:MAG TPA: sigma-70 family RNA polymerase sigma factor [Polyangiaceae bacterium]
MSRSDLRAELEEFERAILSHSPNLLAVACRLARSRSDAEDLVQDTLVKALRARTQYESGTNLKAWLLKILKNTFINRYRRSGLERNVLDGPDADPLADGWIGAATLRAMRDPEGQALRPALEREIGTALDSIPEEFRIVVVLADVEELSYREIADTIGCPIGTVMSRLHRGRRLLKGCLIEQARAMGLVADEPAPAPETPAEKPLELEAFRAKRSAR